MWAARKISFHEYRDVGPGEGQPLVSAAILSCRCIIVRFIILVHIPHAHGMCVVTRRVASMLRRTKTCLPIVAALLQIVPIGSARAAESLAVTFAYEASKVSSAAVPAPRTAGPTTLQLERKADAATVTYADQRTTPYSPAWCADTARSTERSRAQSTTGLRLQVGYDGKSDSEVFLKVDLDLSELEALHLLPAGNCYRESPVISSTQLRGTYAVPLSGKAVSIPLANDAGVFVLRVEGATGS